MCPSWIPAGAWEQLQGLEQLGDKYRGLTQSLSEDSEGLWLKFMDDSDPLHAPLPVDWGYRVFMRPTAAAAEDVPDPSEAQVYHHVDPAFVRLALVRLLREEEFVQATHQYISITLGPSYSDYQSYK